MEAKAREAALGSREDLFAPVGLASGGNGHAERPRFGALQKYENERSFAQEAVIVNAR
jgi:hypothetical protein